MKRKFGSVLLCLCMVLTLLPVSAQAVEPEATHANHCICGATHAAVGDHNTVDEKTWTAWDSDANTNYTTTLPTAAGSYYLTNNVTLTGTWTPANGTFLCLNGYSITCNAGSNSSGSDNVAAIEVKQGRIFTLTDCKSNNPGQIKHGDSNYGCGVYVNGGTFNMYGGSITGNNNTSANSGGGVSVGDNMSSTSTFNMYGGTISGNTSDSNNCSGGGVRVKGLNSIKSNFNMYGGTISGNSAASYGGGVCVEAKSAFKMSGGSIITGNTANMQGGGVYIEGNSTFDMSGGTISGNSAAYYGGGVSASGDFKMSGGKITGNNVSNTSYNGGGVYVKNTGTFTVSGNVQVKDNVKGGTKNSTSGVYEKGGSGSINNVYLPNNKTITIDGALDNTANIGVTTENPPISPNYVEIANAGTDYNPLTDTDKAAFTPDGGASSFHIVKNGNQLKLGAGSAPVHSHTWSYSASGTTITATCNAEGCTSPSGGSITIAAPESSALTYNGEAKAATLTNNLTTGVSAPNISYQKKLGENSYDTATTTAPKNAGDYKASITLGSATASVEYSITAKEVSSPTVTVADGTYNYTGSQIKPSVTVKDGSTTIPASEYTVEYSNNINAGTATVTITDKTGGNYTLTTVTKTFTIGKATYSGTAIATTKEVLISTAQTGVEVDMTSLISGITGAAVSAAAEGTDSNNLIDAVSRNGNKVTFNVASVSTVGVTATINVTITSTNYNNITATITVKTTDKENAGTSFSGTLPTEKIYGDEFTLAAQVTAAGTNGSWTWTSSDDTVLAVTGNGATATVKALKSGSATITAQYESDTTKGSAVTESITVNKRTISVTANDKSMTVNGSLPTFDVTYGNFATGDTKDSVIDTEAVATVTTDGKTVGSFTITVTTEPTLKDGMAEKYTINKVTGTLTVNAASSTPSGGSGRPTVTVPVTSDAGSVNVKAEVSRGTATVKVSDKQIEQVAASGSGTVTIDVSGAKNVESVKLPAQVVEATNKAEDTGLTVALPDGSVALDPAALESASKGEDIIISVQQVPATDLTVEQQKTVGDMANIGLVVDVDVYVGGTKQSSFNGGKLTISIPYTPKAGEDTSKLTVWFIRDDGTIENKGGHYDAENGCFVFVTDHLSRYFLVNVNEQFSDVAIEDYYAAAVNWAVSQNITNGIGDGKFGPDLGCTRGQIVTFLYRCAVAQGVDVTVGESTNILSYTDALEVPEYAFEAFQWAVGTGIIQGSDGKLMPNDDCTRGQIVTMLYRYAVATGKDVSVGEDTNILSYTDFASVPEFAIAPFQWACGANIIQGADGKLMPNDTCTRGQIVTMLYRANG